MIPRIVALILLALWVPVFLFVLLGVGLSGGSVTSLSGLWHDTVSADPAVLLRLIAWLVLLVPLYLIICVVRPARRNRKKT